MCLFERKLFERTLCPASTLRFLLESEAVGLLCSVAGHEWNHGREALVESCTKCHRSAQEYKLQTKELLMQG